MPAGLNLHNILEQMSFAAATAATRMNRSRLVNSSTRNNFKVYIDCKARIDPTDPDTKEWLALTKLFEHRSDTFRMFQGILEKKRKIVAKIGKPDAMKNEIQVAEKLKLLRLPTFMTFLCDFTCFDDFKSLSDKTRSLCKTSGTELSIAIMDYIEGHSLETYPWSRQTFDLLKNVLQHICASLLLASSSIGFVHCDLHLANVLLKRTTRTSIEYGRTEIALNGILPVIMDYDRSRVNANPICVYSDIKKIISLVSVMSDIVLDVIPVSMLCDWCVERKEVPSPEILALFLYQIEKIKIRYVNSEL